MPLTKLAVSRFISTALIAGFAFLIVGFSYSQLRGLTIGIEALLLMAAFVGLAFGTLIHFRKQSNRQ